MKISDNLKVDTPEVKKLKSLFQKEQNYLPYLKALEYGIATYFGTIDVKIKDKDLVVVLENIRDHPTQEINQFDVLLGASPCPAGQLLRFATERGFQLMGTMSLA